MSMINEWKPDFDELTTHSGQPLSPEMRFVVPPPPEIGEIKTAFTNVGVKKPMTTGKRIFYSVLVMLLCVIALSLIMYFGMQPKMDELPILILVNVGISAIPAMLVYFFVNVNFEVSYVGGDGAARFQMKDPEEQPHKSDVVVFADAADIKTAETRHFTNGVYTGTSYSYSWHDADGRSLMTLGGNYHGQDGVPKKLDSPYFFALVCEAIYNENAIQRMADEFERNGFVSFNIAKNKKVKVGDGYLEFDFGGKVDRVSSEDIKSLSIDSGTFKINTNDASFFGSKGKFRFQYGQMGNAQLFLYALEQLAGFQFD
ncbi:MAG: hypothetical protein AAFN77_19650 [Planctomycetota bacterium]